MSNQSSPHSQPKSIDGSFSIEKLPITVNGVDKVATGLNKKTTMGDIKYAMLSVTDPDFRPDCLNNYAVFESWQGNERMLDDQTKIFKLIRLWKSLPGNQLDNVKFFVKAKKRALQQAEAKSQLFQHKLRYEDMSAVDKSKFKFCTLSPDMQKTWNLERIKRNNNKSSYIKKQLLIANKPICFEKPENEYGTLTSMSSRDSSLSSNHSASAEAKVNANKDRYASIKRINRSRNSTVQKVDEPKSAKLQSADSALKESFINLVNMQNKLINKQNQQLKDELEKAAQSINNDEKSEFFQVYNSFFSAQAELNEKMEEIHALRAELNKLKTVKNKTAENSDLFLKANMQLSSSISIENRQTERMNQLGNELARLDDIIKLKQRYVESLHEELAILEELSIKESMINVHKESPHYLDANNNEITSQSDRSTKLNVSSDNESDTGISSVNSDDMVSNGHYIKINQVHHLETLV
jgi:hypothetical protein